MTTTIINPCGHEVVWDLREVNDTVQMWFASLADAEGNTFTAQHRGPGTELIKNNCPQCSWQRTLLMEKARN